MTGRMKFAREFRDRAESQGIGMSEYPVVVVHLVVGGV